MYLPLALSLRSITMVSAAETACTVASRTTTSDFARRDATSMAVGVAVRAALA